MQVAVRVIDDRFEIVLERYEAGSLLSFIKRNWADVRVLGTDVYLLATELDRLLQLSASEINSSASGF